MTWTLTLMSWQCISFEVFSYIYQNVDNVSLLKEKEKKITQFSLVCFVGLMDPGNCLIHSFSIINVENYIQSKLKLT